jgi:hypothetical protein
MSSMARGDAAVSKTTAAPSLRREGLALGLVAILVLPLPVSAGDAITTEHVTLSPSVGSGAATHPPRAKRLVTSEIQRAYETLPLYFIPNQGQADDTVRFYEQSRGHTALFTNEGMSLSLLSTAAVPRGRPTWHVVKLTALGANPAPDIVAERLQRPRINSFLGSDPARWKSDLPTYAALLYREVYPGIDIRFHGQGRDLEYDVIVGPGADPSVVRLALQGIEGLSLTSEGQLRMKLKEGDVVQKPPYVYQEIEGRRTVVEGRFTIHDSPSRSEGSQKDLFVYGFEVGAYDRSHALIIDPTLFYSSLLGGSGADNGLSITVRPGGTVFVTGGTLSANFDTKAGSYDLIANGGSDAFVSKFDVNQAGAASLVYSTYLGGSNFDEGTGIEVDGSGVVYVTGSTDGGGFPTTAGAYDNTYNGGPLDTFVTKLNATGTTLLYSTYLGGTGIDEQRDMALDAATGIVYITGRTTTPGGSGGFDAYAVKFNPAGGGASDLVWYFFLGGTGDDEGNGIEVAPGGIAYVTGTTVSNPFPTTAGAFDATYNGGGDAFVTVVNAAGTAPTYSTYLGGAGNDVGRSITIDASGNAYVAGETSSNPFPTTAGAFDTTANGGVDGFVAKFNPSLSGAASLIYSTYLGGSSDDAALGVAADGALGVCLTGYTLSSDFPTVAPLQAANAGSRDTFVSHLNAAGSALTFSTYLGGTTSDTGFGVDMVGELCCVVGTTASSDYPTTAGAFQAGNDGGSDVCVTCMSQVTTAVELMAFEASPLDSAVELTWQTGSELWNLGFHLYRSLSAEGPYDRITSAVIPGLGSSPVGASYRYVDKGVANGVMYFYKLEDIETTGRTKLHGPVWAAPQASSSSGGGASDDIGGSGSGSSGGSSTTRTAYGDPSSASLRVLERSEGHALLELRTGGFYAVRQADGSVVLEIPGMEEILDPGLPALPVKRAYVEAPVGRRVRLGAIGSYEVLSMPGLRPGLSGSPEMVVSGDGVVRARVRRAEMARTLRPGLFPVRAARLVGTAFQGELKKALVEMWPLRWDSSSSRLELARRLVVRLEFSGKAEGESSRGGVERGRRYPAERLPSGDRLLGQLVVRQRGLHAVSFEELLDPRWRSLPVRELRLSRQGEPVAFHLEPAGSNFGPGSVLYFHTEGASLNPYGNEAVYELSLSRGGGVMMPLVSASPSGSATSFAWSLERREENKSFQPGLLEAPDIWLWDSLIAPVTKRFSFAVQNLVPTVEPSQLTVFLQGGSDQEGVDDHHVRILVNGSAVGEAIWDGKTATALPASIGPGILREGENLLELESLGDAGANYSLAFLDRFELVYPRSLSAPDGLFEGRFSLSGSAEVSGLGAGSLFLDTTSPATPRWLIGASMTQSGIAFRVEAGRQCLALSPQNLLHPEVRLPIASSLRSTRNRADYLLLAPQAFLAAAEPLLDLRSQQGLAVKAAALEEVYQDFGHGEATPRAIRDFIAYAYHFWQSPSPRYVLLLGDASYDYKDVLQSGASNPVPPLLVKTSFLWTASDSAYAAVNGEDLLPDLALGRLPAASVSEAEALVEKIIAFESSGFSLAAGPAVLIADNPDLGGDFESSARQVAPLLAPSHTVEPIFLRELGGATRPTIVAALDRGAALVSYLGHGGIAVWASENVFNNQDVATLSPQRRQPLLLTMDCLNGYFHFPFLNALAEELLKAPGKGSIASFAPSGLSLHGPADLFHQALIREITSGQHERLGDAVFAAQADFAQTGAFPELLSIYNLLGDPALRIRD